ncbi:response regulator [candidate division WWE3 bacterium CG_4_9_14_3_um_filter_41_6]|uniref:Response regulator n=1 Tax=candidate division WWE3 bacterium CG_4_10_14_0_2_um_filter_41_14 TaxID=1975072 RepID=A0A2M7TI85_UNCKA|nr:MAG: response regulator [candidate division WWE3 bacterium CG_4_10_14_0_2_um_filter_41_14]PJA38991.1 MAG: response regulator [candidate division WWE3 bacterium CG_4_9_14_3_um_filter_41_6]
MADKERILIVEDDFFIRELYERQFTKEGYDVLVADDGAKGLVMASQEKPELILLDIMLPKLNGLDLLRTLKTKDETKSIPVILLTNLGQESVIKEGFELGAESYLIKSAYTPSQIIEEIKNFLESRA